MSCSLDTAVTVTPTGPRALTARPAPSQARPGHQSHRSHTVLGTGCRSPRWASSSHWSALPGPAPLQRCLPGRHAGRGPGSTLHSRRTGEPGVLPCRSLGRAPPQCLWEKIGLQTQNKRPPPSYCHALGALSPLLFILEGKPTERRERWGAKRKREGRRKSKREQRREGKPNPARSPARAQARPAEEPKRCRGERG